MHLVFHLRLVCVHMCICCGPSCPSLFASWVQGVVPCMQVGGAKLALTWVGPERDVSPIVWWALFCAVGVGHARVILLQPRTVSRPRYANPRWLEAGEFCCTNMMPVKGVMSWGCECSAHHKWTLVVSWLSRGPCGVVHITGSLSKVWSMGCVFQPCLLLSSWLLLSGGRFHRCTLLIKRC